MTRDCAQLPPEPPRFIALPRMTAETAPQSAPAPLGEAGRRPSNSGAPEHGEAASATPRRSVFARAVVVAFLISLIIPMYFHLGPIRLSPYRLFLLALFLPLLAMWLQGAAGRIRAPDLFVLGFAIWGALTFHLSNSGATVQTLGIWVLETFGAYLIGRVMIRDSAAFAAFARTFVLIVAGMLPLLLFENLTERRLLSELIAPFGNPFFDYQMDKRLGLERAQGPFEHPILLGMFCSMAFTASLIAARSVKAIALAVLCGASTFTSLSSGAYTAVAVQIFLLSWNFVFNKIRQRWIILIGIGIACYALIDIASNRSPIAVFISYATFQPHTAYHRILIWEYGSNTVWSNPILGVGFNDWERAAWMSSSVDNFWLLVAMRHGLPGFVFIALAVASIIGPFIGKSSRDAGLGGEKADHRTKFNIMILSICVAICTVHLWGATFAFFMFLLGAGGWLTESNTKSRTSI